MCNYSDFIEKSGEKKNAIETARRMIRLNKYGDNEIAEISGLPLNEIQKLKKEELVLA